MSKLERMGTGLASLRELLVDRMEAADKAAAGCARRMEELGERLDMLGARGVVEGAKVTHELYAEIFRTLIPLVDDIAKNEGELVDAIKGAAPPCLLCDDSGRDARGRACIVCGVAERAIEVRAGDPPEKLLKIAEDLGAEVEHTGGNVWVVVVECEGQGVAVITEDAVCFYESREAWNESEEPAQSYAFAEPFHPGELGFDLVDGRRYDPPSGEIMSKDGAQLDQTAALYDFGDES